MKITTNQCSIGASLKFKFWLVTKNWNHLSFVNISKTLVIDTSMERSPRVLQHGNPNFFSSKKFEIEFWLVLKSWNYLSFVNISHTLVIDIHQWKGFHQYYSMETQKFWIFFKEVLNLIWLVQTSWNHLSFVNISLTLVLIHQWKGLHKYYNMET